MIRRALIIYCPNTKSGRLEGTVYDNKNYRNFLKSNLGGDWRDNEIISLENPTSLIVRKAIQLLNSADYTFIVFSGHGYINTNDSRQYLELTDGDITTFNLRSNALRQTLLIDACRGFYIPQQPVIKGFSDTYENFTGSQSTREIFDRALIRADSGWTILYAASENQSALDTGGGGAYLLSLLEITEAWYNTDRKSNILPLDVSHERAKKYLLKNYESIQVPVKNSEKRKVYFPFAVKFTLLQGSSW